MKNKLFSIMIAEELSKLPLDASVSTVSYDTNFSSMRSPSDVRYRKKRKRLNRIANRSRIQNR